LLFYLTDFLMLMGLGVAVANFKVFRDSACFELMEIGVGLGTQRFNANLRLSLSVRSLTLMKRLEVDDSFFFLS